MKCKDFCQKIGNAKSQSIPFPRFSQFGMPFSQEKHSIFQIKAIWNDSPKHSHSTFKNKLIWNASYKEKAFQIVDFPKKE